MPDETPDLVAAVLAEPRHLPGFVCGVIRYEREDPALGAQIRAAIAVGNDDRATERVFRRHGIEISYQVIAAHRRNECQSCKRQTS